MVKKTTPAPFSKVDIDALADLTHTLRKFGVYDLTPGTEIPRVQLCFERAIEAINAMGSTPLLDIERQEHCVYYEFVHNGVTFCGVFYPRDLPKIGYHLVDGKPVPKTA